MNQALQLSNIVRQEEAARVLGETRAMELRDPIQSRLLRNFEAITINGQPVEFGGPFDSFSTANGCVIGRSCLLTEGGIPKSVDLTLPVSTDTIEAVLIGQLVQVQGTEPLITPPLVDEPITGVGNDDLWQVHCNPGTNDERCPSEERGGKK